MSAVEKAIPQALALVIGQAIGGGFFSGITQEDGKRYANITAGAEHELTGKWGEYGEKIEGADSHTNSRANTEAMAAAGGELAQKVLALSIGGHDDWGIPARDVQELQYRHLKPTTEENYCSFRDGDNPSSQPASYPYSAESPAQTSVDAFREDEPEAFKDAWYWSSTQRSALTAYTMTFGVGSQYDFGKTHELRVRPVRRLLID